MARIARPVGTGPPAFAPLPDTPIAHYTVAAFMSDMTGTSFRPYSLGEWGTHADASIDHALWFHREPWFDEWVYVDFHALVNHAGRSTVRGEFYDGEGRIEHVDREQLPSDRSTSAAES